MDTLNSQLLTYQDGYLHAFRRPGTYEYRILFLAPGFEAAERGVPHVIEVTEQGREAGNGEQHDITLRWDPEHVSYHCDPAKLTVAVNDFVLWRVETSTPAVPPYSIRGAAKDGAGFDSRALGQSDVFTHLFMQPGKYAYRVNGRAAGVVAVRDHREEPEEAYAKYLQEAPLVQIARGRPEPDELTVVAGQTVIWLVKADDRVTIAAEPGEPRST
jgi:plastocyanin